MNSDECATRGLCRVLLELIFRFSRVDLGI